MDREIVRQPLFSKEGDVSRAAASLLLLLAGDDETNPGPSCYAFGQNFRQSDTPLNCHAQDCSVRTHKQTRCSGVHRSQQPLPWHCSTHGGPGPPVTTQTSHACYSCQHPFRPGTRPLACHAQGCMNPAQVARRCSGPTAPPDQWCCLHHSNSCRRSSICPHPPVSTPETKTESPAEAAAARLLPTSGRSSTTTAATRTTAPGPASPAAQPTQAQATGRALGALPPLHLHPSIIFQVVLLLNQNTIKAGAH